MGPSYARQSGQAPDVTTVYSTECHDADPRKSRRHHQSQRDDSHMGLRPCRHHCAAHGPAPMLSGCVIRRAIRLMQIKPGPSGKYLASDGRRIPGALGYGRHYLMFAATMTFCFVSRAGVSRGPPCGACLFVAFCGAIDGLSRGHGPFDGLIGRRTRTRRDQAGLLGRERDTQDRSRIYERIGQKRRRWLSTSRCRCCTASVGRRKLRMKP